MQKIYVVKRSDMVGTDTTKYIDESPYNYHAEPSSKGWCSSIPDAMLYNDAAEAFNHALNLNRARESFPYQVKYYVAELRIEELEVELEAVEKQRTP